MYKLIAVTSAISTHCTMVWSIHEPGGGALGRMLRSRTIANRFAANQVANGGKVSEVARGVQAHGDVGASTSKRLS